MESRAETMDAAEMAKHSGLKVIAGVPARNVAPVIFNTIGAGLARLAGQTKKGAVEQRRIAVILRNITAHSARGL